MCDECAVHSSTENDTRMRTGVEVLVITNRIKAHNKAAGFSTSGAYIDALSEEVARLLQKSQRCAELSGRKTLKPQDL